MALHTMREWGRAIAPMYALVLLHACVRVRGSCACRVRALACGGGTAPRRYGTAMGWLGIYSTFIPYLCVSYSRIGPFTALCPFFVIFMIITINETAQAPTTDTALYNAQSTDNAI